MQELLYNEENLQRPMWKLYLYQLQKEAPKPSAVFRSERLDEVPPQYGLEYHGLLHRHKCQELLAKEGNYLVRQNKSDDRHHILSLRFSGVVKHYRLYYDGGRHYVGEKKFVKLNDLLSDGLVTLYLESRASKFLLQLPTANYRQSPYFTLNRSARQALKKSKYARTRRHNQALDITPKKNNLSEPTSGKGSNITTKIPEEELNIKIKEKEESDSFERSLRQTGAESSNKSSSSNSLDKSDVEDAPYDRPHRFNNHSFTGLHWCGFCGNFLWGLMLQGVKCVDCGLKAHRPCSLKVPNDCCPDLKNSQCVFGMDLSTSLQSCSSRESLLIEEPRLVPTIVSECIAEIESRGLLIEGIYRVPGSHEQMDALRLNFERDPRNSSLDERTVPDINVVAGLLKMYFRLLPLRLITTECFNKLVEANKLAVPDERINSIKGALRLLPVPHYHTLKALVAHFTKICEQSVLNKMNATSLSTIFGPTLIHSGPQIEKLSPEDLLALKMNAQEPRVIEMIIILHKDIFNT